MLQYLIFVDPKDSVGLLTLDNGLVIKSHPAKHPSGREGIAFDIPDNAPNGNGCLLVLGRLDYFDEVKRGILWLDFESNFADVQFDDFRLIKKPAPCPEPVPEPIPDPKPSNHPAAIMDRIYKTGKYDLGTKKGCGEFTEEVTRQFHLQDNQWGHIKKIPPQNCWPPDDGNISTKHHAVDANMLLANYLVDGELIKSGIYDLIFDTESPNAKPQFIRTGDVNTNLWYYPHP